MVSGPPSASNDYDYDHDLIQGKGNACKPAQYIVTLLLTITYTGICVNLAHY